MFEEINIAFIGSGTMAEAMIRGLLTKKIVAPSHIIASGPRPQRGKLLQERHGIRVTVDKTERLPYLAYAARAFFENGGKRLYVSLGRHANSENCRRPSPCCCRKGHA